MDDHLWNRLLAFDLDAPMSEYGFSTRLARENYWTKNFTTKAILEYKKFMYLAGTSDLMVSPSEVIDVVWHQHLTFTQSYAEFCAILGKQIQHVPSTRRKEDFEKFRSAKERTGKLYNKMFGEQPEDIWKFPGMYESLRLEKASIKIRTFLLFGILAWAILTVPAYYILRPLYVHIDNPDFLLYYVSLAVICMVALTLFDRQQALNVLRDAHPSSFLFDLQPLEFVYLKTRKLAGVINGTLSQLLGRAVIESDRANLHLVPGGIARSLEQYQVLEILKGTGPISYKRLLHILEVKPTFTNTQDAMDAMKKYFIKSKKFGRIFYLNFGILSFLFLLGFIRLITGVLRDRPVDYITITMLLLAVTIVIFLEWHSRVFVLKAVTSHYKKQFTQLKKREDEWEWQYAFYGAAFLVPALTTLADDNTKFSWTDSGGWSSSDSSCGSSCSSCGGCGD